MDAIAQLGNTGLGLSQTRFELVLARLEPRKVSGTIETCNHQRGKDHNASAEQERRKRGSVLLV